MLRLIATLTYRAVSLAILSLSLLIANAAGTTRSQSAATREAEIRRSFEAGEIDNVLELMKVSKKDQRYYDYMYVHLDLRYVHARRDKAGKLDAGDRKRVVSALKRLHAGQILWVMDRLGVFAHIEKAHALYLLGKAKDAEETMHQVWASIRKVDAEFDGQQKKDGPVPPALYHLAHIYIARYKETRAGTAVPSIYARNKWNACTREENVRHYLSKAYNILLVDLQKRDIRESAYSERAIRDIPQLTAMLDREGIRTRKMPAALARKVAYENGMRLYREGNYADAGEELRKAILNPQGGLRVEGDRASLAVSCIIACDYKLGQFIAACKAARTFVKLFPQDDRSWSSLRNAIVMSSRALPKIEAEAEQGKLQELVLSLSQLFLDKKPQHAFTPTARWLIAERQFALAQNSHGKATFDLAFAKAVASYNALASAHPKDRYGKLAACRLAALNQLAGRKKEAARLFQMYSVFGDVPMGPRADAGYRAALLYYELGRYDDAITRLDGVVAFAPSSDPRIVHIRRQALVLKPWCLANKGTALHRDAEALRNEARQLRETRDTYSNALTQDPTSPTVAVALPVVERPAVAPQPFVKGEPPNDFALTTFMAKIGAKADLAEDLAGLSDLSVRLVDGRLWISSGTDCGVTLPGSKSQVTIRGNRCEWIPSALACYRRGGLIGVYDFDELRITTDRKTDETIQLPAASETASRLEIQIHIAWAAARCRLLDSEARKLDKQAVLLRGQAADALAEFVNDPRNLRDADLAPRSLRFLIQLRQEQNRSAEVAQAFKLLRSTYPDHEFTGKALVEILAHQARDGGSIDAGLLPELKKHITTMKLPVLTALAFKSFRTDDRGEPQNPMLKVAMAALDELQRRCNGKLTMARLASRATYFKAKAFYIKKDYAEAVKHASIVLSRKKKTLCHFKAAILKGKALRAVGQLEAAIGAFNHVLSMDLREKSPKLYWEAYIETGETLVLFKDESYLLKAKRIRIMASEADGIIPLELSRSGAWEIYRRNSECGVNAGGSWSV